uniref:Uncharacterized protein n=1 Tax=Anguilla anguilla TaxID=7936 RepID=A0A0E9PIC7_ANGAN
MAKCFNYCTNQDTVLKSLALKSHFAQETA